MRATLITPHQHRVASLPSHLKRRRVVTLIVSALLCMQIRAARPLPQPPVRSRFSIKIQTEIDEAQKKGSAPLPADAPPLLQT